MFKSLRKVLFQVQSHTDNRTEAPGATRDSLISDISGVNQYRNVVSEDIKMDILPIIPRQQVFEAVMTHVDDNAVVWVVSQDDISKLTEVKANC